MWEIDIFGKYRREIEAARFDSEAAAAARYAVITSIVADVVRAYVDLRGFQIQAGVLRQASDVLRESLRIVNIRYQRGITNELDVTLATRELELVDSQIAPAQAQVNAAQYALAVLLGEYPESIVQELKTPELIPTMPGPVAPGAPLDLLKRRPDIQQAERELARGHGAHRRGDRGSVPPGGAHRFDRQPARTGIGNGPQRRSAHLVVRSRRHLAAAWTSARSTPRSISRIFRLMPAC